MIPVDQDVFGLERGNCFSACVASILELPLARVPFFMSKADWLPEFAAWLDRFRLYPVTFKVSEADPWRPDGFYILGGQSPRGSHAVVARRREVVHDPHPGRAGLVSIEDATLLVPHHPADVVGDRWRR